MGDLFVGQAETDTSSYSGDEDVFETQQQFVFELRDLRRDDPDQPPTVQKLKKQKRKVKKNANKARVASSSSSSSEDSLPSQPLEGAKEEFYDAHESYHALPEHYPSQTELLGASRHPSISSTAGRASSGHVSLTSVFLAENHASSVTAPAPMAALMMSHSAHGQDPKLNMGTTGLGQASVPPREPSSTITKPVPPPD